MRYRHKRPPLQTNNVKPYNYDALLDAPYAGEVRLIHGLRIDHNDILCCQLVKMRIDQLPPFHALSYTWKGDLDSSSTPQDKVLVGDQYLMVGRNLALALRAVKVYHQGDD
ncbi:hypothetical protein FHL15_011402 [Xylaria flabelliformis]|uniref:Heterokaryon incompatibility domain-containing protein n=1 Tax=Xylaria flabelliformis TaxID=2512241 RepID=A0A553HIB5_9PEZI|nr:hypothetical protein FHL15_011402 [Xylaria flabelliformis]